MSYFELFPYVALAWGIWGLVVSFKGESSHPFKYNLLSKLWPIVGWMYMVACVPVFRDGQYIDQTMTLFFSIIAMLLSLEIWTILLGTLMAVALVKKTHDPQFTSLFLSWHQPLRNVLKPMLLLVSVAHIINTLYFLIK